MDRDIARWLAAFETEVPIKMFGGIKVI